MEAGSVVVDVAVDQGGCIETTRPTTHSEPVYEVDNIIHYAVTNIPGAVARTSTYALTSVTLPYVTEIADVGPEQALKNLPVLRRGLNTYGGKIIHSSVAESLGLPWIPTEQVLS